MVTSAQFLASHARGAGFPSTTQVMRWIGMRLCLPLDLAKCLQIFSNAVRHDGFLQPWPGWCPRRRRECPDDLQRRLQRQIEYWKARASALRTKPSRRSRLPTMLDGMPARVIADLRRVVREDLDAALRGLAGDFAELRAAM